MQRKRINSSETEAANPLTTREEYPTSGYSTPMNSAPMIGMPSALGAGRIVVGLDVGTTKVCAIVAAISAREPHTMTILGVGHAPADGLSRGVVTNIEKTVGSIEKAVAEAEAQSGVKIREVVVGIAGDHI